MKTVQYTVRVPAVVDKAMQKLAAQQSVTPYEMLQRCVKAGVASLTNPPAQGTNDRELVAELASASTRIAGSMLTRCDGIIGSVRQNASSAKPRS